MLNDTIKGMVSKQLGIDASSIADDSLLIEDLGADSIDLVEMLLMIEENLGIYVSDEDAVTLKTVGDVVTYIEMHQAQPEHA